ncbi:beta-phosphoglucomutase [Paenibacillus glucanolyticus]|jgi:beta-phosphoglucomutase|uniref:beta-phosphoglucomutase n=1 Tax=Paenibacillus TaxID=44249 RepID=UPI0003E27FC9|nr:MULTISPECIES: beta-phosphoglucomutase [Paenibacillus]ANA80704.1 beta-phosphoglucomutase [Paenibacillus glucanolyticus]AVV55225.1 beta-phosphoglucomutase [Paenibacillus glucanolyticus]ETT30829.1 beta-phosphoglucomutase [Paenibacillus sp. FSL R5-808]
MSSITACLFDLDGVLVDTAKYHYIAWKRLAGELGFDFTEQDNERLKGVSRMASLDILLEIGGMTLDEDAKLALAEKKNAWYVEYISKMDESEILPGALDFIQALKARGIKVALGSASKNAMLILNNTGLTPYFDAIIDGTKTSQAKPDPEVFTMGAHELDVQPDTCVVFEDAEAGIEAATRAGMRSVGIGSPETLGRADIVLSSLEEFTVDRLLEL